MDDSKFTSKLKEGVSVQEVEDFARKYTWEVLTVLVIVAALLSGVFNWFLGGPSWVIIFTAAGAILGTLAPVPVEHIFKRCSHFIKKQERLTQIILGVVQIVVAIFVPCIVFGVIGLLAGTAHDYFTHHAHQAPDGRGSFGRGDRPRGSSSNEHD